MTKQENEYAQFLKWKALQKKEVKKKEVKTYAKTYAVYDVNNISAEQFKEVEKNLSEVLNFVNEKQASDWKLKSSKTFKKELDGKEYLAVSVVRTTPKAESRTMVYAGYPWAKSWKMRWNNQPIDAQ